MQRAGSLLVFAVMALIFSCATTESARNDFFTMHGAELEESEMGVLLTAPGENAMALLKVGPYTREFRCEFTLQTIPDQKYMNGFLLLGSQRVSESVILAGIYIGGREFVIEGRGVKEPIRVPADFDEKQVFDIAVFVNLDEGYIEMKINGREIGARLIDDIKAIDLIGYHGKSTATYFSSLKFSGK